MHCDSSLRRRSWIVLLCAYLAVLTATLCHGMLIPPQAGQEDLQVLEHYRKLIEALHEQSGGYHQRFKALKFQQESADQQLSLHDEAGKLEDNQKNGVKQESRDRDGDDDSRVKLVPVILGVMSKCPDAEICESVFDKTLGEVGNLVDLKTVYIGRLNPKSRPYGVDCMHGSQECDGNVQQLCVRDSSETSQRDWWNFIQCQNFQGLKRVGDLSVAKQCAKVIGKDWDAEFSDCYTGSRGAKLLRDSVKEAEKLKIEKSCTIIINDKLVCIHDGSWKDCISGHESSDFAKYIKKEYSAINGEK